jgi:hypothetical protein
MARMVVVVMVVVVWMKGSKGSMRECDEGTPDEVQQEGGEDGLSNGWCGVCIPC